MLKALRRAVATSLIVLIVGTALAPSTASAQSPTAATITRVFDGGTVQATLPTGQAITVGLITLHTPEPGRGVYFEPECGGPEARAALRQLVEGQPVTLTPDPTQETVDSFGRSLFYVDRGDGLDVGLEMVRRGWGEVVWPENHEPQRLNEYTDTEAAAEKRDAGVWRLCDGDFNITLRQQQTDSAEAFVKLYYRRTSKHEFLPAWRMLGARRQARVGSFRKWKAGFARSHGVAVLSADAQLAEPRRVFVEVRLRSRDRDACTHRIVTQYLRGFLVLAPHRDSWLVVGFQILKTVGRAPQLSTSQCPA